MLYRLPESERVCSGICSLRGKHVAQSVQVIVHIVGVKVFRSLRIGVYSPLQHGSSFVVGIGFHRPVCPDILKNPAIILDK